MPRPPKNPFNQSEISFSESDHKYTEISTGKNLIPVSVLLGLYCAPFDPTGFILKKSAAKEGIPADELRKRWDKKREDACDTGHRAHEQLEYYFLNNKIDESGADKDIINKFIKIQFKGKVYPEILVYDTKLGISGQSDIADYIKKDNSVAIQDLKTNGEMYKKVYKNLLYPLNKIQDTKINRYSLQISAYCYLLERRGFKIRSNELCLYWVNPARDIEIIPVKYLKQDVENMIDHYLNGIEFF